MLIRPAVPLLSSIACVAEETRQQRVYFWGHRSAIPLKRHLASTKWTEEAGRSSVRSPLRHKWFEAIVKRGDVVKWKRLALGPNFGAALADDASLYLWAEDAVFRDGSALEETWDIMEMGPHLLRMESALRMSYPSNSGDLERISPRNMSAGSGPYSKKHEEDGHVAPGDICYPKIIDIQCSRSSVWCLSSSGHVFVVEKIAEQLSAVGSGAQEAVRVSNLPFRGHRIIKLAVGPGHVLLLTDEGSVFAMGENDFGQCGVMEIYGGKTPLPASSVAEPLMVRFYSSPQIPKDVPIVDIAVGSRHSAALDGYGNVWTWGDDSCLQLGHGDVYARFHEPEDTPAPDAQLRFFDRHCQTSPKLMQSIPLGPTRSHFSVPYPPPDHILCGGTHTMVAVDERLEILTEREAMAAREPMHHAGDGQEAHRIFAVGNNGSGQGGRSMQQAAQAQFSAVRLPRNSKVTHASCGAEHCLVALSSDGDTSLWGWGGNKFGQVGSKRRSHAVCPPLRIKLRHPCQVQHLSCGYYASGIITEEVAVLDDSVDAIVGAETDPRHKSVVRRR